MKVAAFNVKNLGMKKVNNKRICRLLVKIISRYSMIVILEVVDKSGKAMEKLHQELNATRCNRTRPYSMVASTQLGRDTYKERFVCFYRPDEAKLTACHQYEDNQPGDEDAFAREPFILRFHCPATLVKDLVLIPVHTKPEDSLKELDELHDVVDAVRKNWGNDNIMILGDFNADGRYLSKKKLRQIRIFAASYHWLIGDEVDTTASNNNDNTYDRIVVYGDSMLKAVVSGSAKSLNFQKKFGLTDEETLGVSDHYPVEVELKSHQKQKPPQQQKTAVPRQRKLTPGQTQRRGPQKTDAVSSGPQKKKVMSTGPQKSTMSTGPQKTKAASSGPQKKKTTSTGPQKKKTNSAGQQRKATSTGPQKKKTTSSGPQKKKTNSGQQRKATCTGPQKKKTNSDGQQRKATSTGPQKKKTTSSGPQKKKTNSGQQRKATCTGPQKKATGVKRKRGRSPVTVVKRQRLNESTSSAKYKKQ